MATAADTSNLISHVQKLEVSQITITITILFNKYLCHIEFFKHGKVLSQSIASSYKSPSPSKAAIKAKTKYNLKEIKIKKMNLPSTTTTTN
jgi:hypothetical protein